MIDRPATWTANYAEAVALQNTLRTQVITQDQLGAVRRVAGLDVGLTADKCDMRAAIAVLDLATLTIRVQALAHRPTTFPCILEWLSLRKAHEVGT